jgi:hypothetical protein
MLLPQQRQPLSFTREFLRSACHFSSP